MGAVDSEQAGRRLTQALRDHRNDLGLSQEAIANRLGYDRRTIIRIELGDVCPSEKYMAAWLRVFHDDPKRVGVEAAYDQVRAQRRASRMLPGVMVVPDLQQLELLRRGVNSSLGQGTLSEATLDDWEQSALRHGAAARDRPAGVLLADVANDLADLQRVRARCRSASAVRRLTRVMAQMSGLMVLALVKLDERAAFRGWARTAWIAADETGDSVTTSWVLAQEAYGHYYSSNLAPAIDVAKHAQAVGGGAPYVGVALAAALEGRAHAVLGRDQEAREALARAEIALSRLDGDSMIASAFGYTESQLRFHESNAYTHLGDTHSAWVAQDRALNLCPAGDYMDRTLTRLDRAYCLARSDIAAGASHLLETLLSLNAQQRRGIISARAREVVSVLSTHHPTIPHGAEINELLRTDAEEADRS